MNAYDGSSNRPIHRVPSTSRGPRRRPRLLLEPLERRTLLTFLPGFAFEANALMVDSGFDSHEPRLEPPSVYSRRTYDAAGRDHDFIRNAREPDRVQRLDVTGPPRDDFAFAKRGPGRPDYVTRTTLSVGPSFTEPNSISAAETTSAKSKSDSVGVSESFRVASVESGAESVTLRPLRVSDLPASANASVQVAVESHVTSEFVSPIWMATLDSSFQNENNTATFSSSRSEADRFGGFVELTTVPPSQSATPAIDRRDRFDVEAEEDAATDPDGLDELLTLELLRSQLSENEAPEDLTDSPQDSEDETADDESDSATDAVLAQWAAASDHGDIIEMSSSRPNSGPANLESGGGHRGDVEQVTRGDLSNIIMEVEAAIGDAQAFEIIDARADELLQEDPIHSSDEDVNRGPVEAEAISVTQAASLGLPFAAAQQEWARSKARKRNPVQGSRIQERVCT